MGKEISGNETMENEMTKNETIEEESLENEAIEEESLENETIESIEIKGKPFNSKVLVPIIIVLIIAGIWFVKNYTNGSGTGFTDGGLTEGEFALNITEDFDLDELRASGLPILLDFGSETCPPCKQMHPDLEKVNKDLEGKAYVKYIDVWQYQDMIMDFPVKVTPTQLFFDKDGNPYMPKNPESSPFIIYSMRDTGEHVYTAHEGALTEGQMLEFLKEMGLKE